MGSGVASAGRWVGDFTKSAVTEGLPNLLPYLDEKVAGGFNMQAVPEDRRTWYNRWEPAPYEGPRVWESEYWKTEFPKIALDATLWGAGSPGGAGAFTIRATKKPLRQLAGALTSNYINRRLPYSYWEDAIDTGNYSAAFADTSALLGGVGGARGASMLAANRGRRIRPFVAGLGAVAGALGGGYAGHSAVRPFENSLGGNVDDLPFLEGTRLPGNEDYVFGRQGELIFDPPVGKYPEWDFVYRGIG